MSWTRPAALRAQVQKLWERGDLLAGDPIIDLLIESKEMFNDG